MLRHLRPRALSLWLKLQKPLCLVGSIRQNPIWGFHLKWWSPSEASFSVMPIDTQKQITNKYSAYRFVRLLNIATIENTVIF